MVSTWYRTRTAGEEGGQSFVPLAEDGTRRLPSNHCVMAQAMEVAQATNGAQTEAMEVRGERAPSLSLLA